MVVDYGINTLTSFLMIKASVIINTYNRSHEVIECLRAIIKNDLHNIEILVVEQCGQGDLGEEISNLHTDRVFYFNLNKRGASLAKNFGIQKAKGNIVIFTDDDCLPSQYWLEEILNSFEKNINIVAVFGRSLPYKPHERQGFVCPSVFNKKIKGIYSSPVKHWVDIGFGNNMSFRKDIFQKLGLFKTWLGPGSLCHAAEDAEIIYRILYNGYTILYNPHVLIYHNRWLKMNGSDLAKQIRNYRCGEFAAYGYYGFKGDYLGKSVVMDDLCDLFKKILDSIRDLSLVTNHKLLIRLTAEVASNIKGLMVAFWFSRF